MAVDPRQVLAGVLTITMFVMLGDMIKRDHFDQPRVCIILSICVSIYIYVYMYTFFCFLFFFFSFCWNAEYDSLFQSDYLMFS